MRSSRMRGYGSWTIGWREGERKSNFPDNNNNNNGCAPLFIGLAILILFSSIKVTLETGNILALLIGIAMVCGIIKGLS